MWPCPRLLPPLYLETVRGRTPLQTGLLLIPQGLGAALAMPAAGALTDRIGARPVVTGGVALALAGTAAHTQMTAGTAYWCLAGALLLIGAGPRGDHNPVHGGRLRRHRPPSDPRSHRGDQHHPAHRRLARHSAARGHLAADYHCTTARLPRWHHPGRRARPRAGDMSFIPGTPAYQEA